MATYRSLTDSASGLKIEVEGSGASADAYMPLLLTSLGQIAQAVAGQLNQIDKELRPDEFEVSFGLKALASGGVAVALDQEAVNFKVRLKWGGSEDALAGPAMPGPQVPGL